MWFIFALLLSRFPEGTKEIIYSAKGDHYIVGVENKATTNAIESKTAVSGLLVIPRLHNGKEITEITNCAFLDCNLITEVQIYARITIFGAAAFDHCSKLSRINIPSSVEVLLKYSIICNDHINGDTSPEGTLEVIFEPGSKNYFG